MEKVRTQADVRHEDFLRHAQAAKDLSRLALAEIDAVIGDCRVSEATVGSYNRGLNLTTTETSPYKVGPT